MIAMLSLSLALSLGTAEIQAGPDVEHVMFGRFWPGMSEEEARAAAPGVAWRTVLLFAPPGESALEGADAVETMGRTWSLSLRDGEDGYGRLELQSILPGGDARNCTAAVHATIAELEARFGAFAAVRPQHGGDREAVLRQLVFDDLLNQLPGHVAVANGLSPRGVVRVGRASEVAEYPSVTRDPWTSWQAVRRPVADDALTVAVGGGIWRNFDNGAPECGLVVLVEHAPPLVDERVGGSEK